MKVAFLDRDGTIIKDYPDKKWQYITKPIFLNGTIEALKKLKDLDYQIIILTNQYLINDGIISLAQYNSFTNSFKNILLQNNIDILDILFCPHSFSENCNCFKPKKGLFEQAMTKYPNINLNKSFIAGDSICDIELGNKIGIKTFGINIKTDNFVYTKIDSLLDLIKHLQ